MLYCPLSSTSAQYIPLGEVLRDYIKRIKRSKEPKQELSKIYNKLKFKVEATEKYLEIAMALKKKKIKKKHIKNTDLLPIFSVIREDGEEYFQLELHHSLTNTEVNASIMYFKHQKRLCQILLDARASLKDLADSINKIEEDSLEKEIFLEVYNRAKYLKRYQ